MAQVALGLEALDELLEGQVLVGVGAEGGPRARGAGASRNVGSPERSARSDEGVGEEADEPVELDAAAVGDRGADDDIVLAGVAAQEDGKAAMSAMKRVAPSRRRAASSAAHESRAEVEEVPRAREGLRRAGAAWSAGSSRTGAPARRVSQYSRRSRTASSVKRRALPDGEVRVLDGQLRERGRPAGGESAVEGGELPGEDAARPAVGGDVVAYGGEDVVVVAEDDETRAEKRAGGEVEGRGDLGGEGFARFGLARGRRDAAKVGYGQRERRGRVGRLHGRAVMEREARPQGLVAPQDLADSALERRNVEAAFDADRIGFVVRAEARLQLVEKPEPLLREG